MSRSYTVTYTRSFPFPLDAVYAWLTDYDDDDPDRAGGVITEREVQARTEETVSMHERVETLGLTRTVYTIVDLDPPDHWTARVHEIGDEEPDIYDYRLASTDEGEACTLTVDYRYTVSLPEALVLRLLGPRVRREIDRMWDGFAAAMTDELTHRPTAETT